jgi:hypothetical protein
VATDSTLAGALQRLERVDKLLTGDLTTLANAMGKAARVAADATAAEVTGGSARLSRMGRRGARLTTAYQVGEQGRKVLVVFRPAGAWVLENTGAGPHTEPRLTRRGKRRKASRGAIFGPGMGHPAATVRHPGVKGKGALRTAADRIAVVVPYAGDAALVRELASIFPDG